MKIVTIILAAGKGTRMKSNLPKVLHKVCGKSMLEHVIETAKNAGSSREVVIIGSGAEEVKKNISGVEFALQAEQLGTGHAVKMAKDKLADVDGTVMILCGDTPLITSDLLKNFIDSHNKSKAAATVLTAIMPDATGYGRIVRNQSGTVDKIVEHKDANEDELQIHEVNAGIYCFDKKILFDALDKVTNDNAQGEYYLTDVLEIIHNQGLVINAMISNDFTQILGINSRQQLALAERILRQRKNFELMDSGVTILDPDSTFIDSNVEIGRDTIIYPFTFIEGNIKIGENCSIGPFVHIRPGSKIGDKVKIGNFVEVKNSNIGEGTKLPHLQYIGDSDVGSNVNIGCGTVTCNYDGKNKFRTTIGNNVFVGCNTNLVAPVNVGDNVYIAAGSTINQDIPKDNLAIARARQVNKSNWKDKRD
ncbi:MAG: NTP transferase domain-containing protein [Selenomonadaceae bacterium]|nr:NTP transferase domain-containing protein [Selenomonadaceae bacterium]